MPCASETAPRRAAPPVRRHRRRRKPAHALNFLQRFPKFIGEAFRAEQARHVPKAVHPKRQRVEHGFAQDDFR